MAYHPREHFNNVAKKMSLRNKGRAVAGRDSPVYRYKRSCLLRMLKQMVITGRRVLEVGCGPGGNLEYLARFDPAKLSGCDISDQMIGLAKQRLRNGARPVDLAVVDGEVLPYEDQSFDTVFSVTVLQHNTDDQMWEQLICEMCRVARSFVVLHEDVARHDCGWSEYRKREVSQYVRLFQQNGFVLEQRQYLYLYWTERLADRFRKVVFGGMQRDGDTEHVLMSLLLYGMLPFSLLLDAVMRRPEGLVRLVFKRVDGSSGSVPEP